MLALFMLSILFLRTLWLFVQNITTIESWEIERHEALVQRARASGGYLSTSDGIRVHIRKQEFPYDIGFFRNMRDAMGGSANVSHSNCLWAAKVLTETLQIISWFWPFSNVPSRNKGTHFVTNGFEDDDVVWPPLDPDQMAKHNRKTADGEPFTFSDATDDPECRKMAFARRQEADLLRRRMVSNRREAEVESGEFQHYLLHPHIASEISSEADFKPWTNSEGERLRDFGVDDVESDEDDIPLAELLKRRRQANAIGATD
ncbi:Palmitoyltransferase [Ascosphaera aggregata]|nr:Palmitoyltransferase [Ascosphaera aggregata]